MLEVFMTSTIEVRLQFVVVGVCGVALRCWRAVTHLIVPLVAAICLLELAGRRPTRIGARVGYAALGAATWATSVAVVVFGAAASVVGLSAARPAGRRLAWCSLGHDRHGVGVAGGVVAVGAIGAIGVRVCARRRRTPGGSRPARTVVAVARALGVMPGAAAAVEHLGLRVRDKRRASSSTPGDVIASLADAASSSAPHRDDRIAALAPTGAARVIGRRTVEATFGGIVATAAALYGGIHAAGWALSFCIPG